MIDPFDHIPDPCPAGCGHPFHGLPCTQLTGLLDQPVCNCPGPWGPITNLKEV